MTYPRGEEEVEVAVQQHLVGMVAVAEALQEAVCQLHHLQHPSVVILSDNNNINNNNTVTSSLINTIIFQQHR